jgi:hypothetical protein
VKRVKVNVDNFTRAETHRMFADLQRNAGGVNRFAHNRTPASVDEQPVIRMNRDTLYSFAIVDISAGATLTVPDASGLDHEAPQLRGAVLGHSQPRLDGIRAEYDPEGLFDVAAHAP